MFFLYAFASAVNVFLGVYSLLDGNTDFVAFNFAIAVFIMAQAIYQLITDAVKAIGR